MTEAGSNEPPAPPVGQSPADRPSGLEWLARTLDDLAAADLIRRPVEVLGAQGPRLLVRTDDGRQRELVNFCSNNYLNLAADPRIRNAVRDAVEQWGFGSGASRLISGTTSLHRQAEQAVAEFLGADDAILLGTGYQTNVAAVTALAGPGDTVLLDKLCHASLIDAARQCGARIRTYPHGDLDRLDALLARSTDSARRCFVLTDSLFSMDGDLAPLAEIAALKSRRRFTLVVDEAHAIGVFGPGGRGVVELLGLGPAVDATVGTCSKALGGMGGFIAGRQVLIDALRNTARGFIYSTAPPAVAAAALLAALDVVRSEPGRRTRLLGQADRLRSDLAASGWSTDPSASQIVPIVLGGAGRALAAQRFLVERGLLAVAIRPPTVPRGTSRLRISLMCDHSEGDLGRLVGALADLRRRGQGP